MKHTLDERVEYTTYFKLKTVSFQHYLFLCCGLSQMSQFKNRVNLIQKVQILPWNSSMIAETLFHQHLTRFLNTSTFYLFRIETCFIQTLKNQWAVLKSLLVFSGKSQLNHLYVNVATFESVDKRKCLISYSSSS